MPTVKMFLARAFDILLLVGLAAATADRKRDTVSEILSDIGSAVDCAACDVCLFFHIAVFTSMLTH